MITFYDEEKSCSRRRKASFQRQIMSQTIFSQSDPNLSRKNVYCSRKNENLYINFVDINRPPAMKRETIVA